MNSQEMIAAMTNEGTWTSPGGKTPHATFYSAILRDLAKGDESRFVKTESRPASWFAARREGMIRCKSIFTICARSKTWRRASEALPRARRETYDLRTLENRTLDTDVECVFRDDDTLFARTAAGEDLSGDRQRLVWCRFCAACNRKHSSTWRTHRHTRPTLATVGRFVVERFCNRTSSMGHTRQRRPRFLLLDEKHRKSCGIFSKVRLLCSPAHYGSCVVTRTPLLSIRTETPDAKPTTSTLAIDGCLRRTAGGSMSTRSSLATCPNDRRRCETCRCDQSRT